jgi:class 3 adenylate cyclase
LPRISLWLKILIFTAGSAAALLAVLLTSVRSAYLEAAEIRMEESVQRMRAVLEGEIRGELADATRDARALAGQVRFRNLMESAIQADDEAERRATLAQLPEVVRNQDVASRIAADRLMFYELIVDEDDETGASDRAICIYRVERSDELRGFRSLPLEQGAGRSAEDHFAAARLAEFFKAAARDPDGEFVPSLLLLAADGTVFAASMPTVVMGEDAEGPYPVGYVVLARELANSEAVHDLDRKVGNPVLISNHDAAIAAALGSADSATREAFSAAIHQTVHDRKHDVTIGTTRWRFVATPLNAVGDTNTLYGIIAFNLNRELAAIDAANAAVWRSAGVVLLGLIAVSLLLAGGITRPIRRLVEATDKVAEGHLDVHLAVKSRDEVGQLTEHFNHMAEGLRERERMRGLLDKVVSTEVAGELMRLERDQKLALGGEVREVTVLFCDLRNFTATTEHMTPQAVIGMLNEYLTAVVEPIDLEQGVVDKFVGDEVMAIFGAPLNQADSAARAVRAAMGMQAAMTRLNTARAERGEPPLAVGIGINTGPAVAGLTGSQDRLSYTVLGATVNLAARLCSAATPGEVIIGEATRADAPDIPVDALDPVEVKGFTKPVAVFRVQAGVDPGSPA